MNYLTVGSGSSYQLTGGTLRSSMALAFWELSTSAAVAALVRLVERQDRGSTFPEALSRTPPKAANMGSNSVLVVPTTFNTSSFASFTTGGLVHQLGTTLVVPSGYNISLSQQFADSITVQGSLTTASGTPLVENKTLTISSGGAVSTPSLEIGTTGSAGQAIQTGGLNQIYTSGFSPSQPYSGRFT